MKSIDERHQVFNLRRALRLPSHEQPPTRSSRRVSTSFKMVEILGQSGPAQQATDHDVFTFPCFFLYFVCYQCYTILLQRKMTGKCLGLPTIGYDPVHARRKLDPATP